MQNRLHRDSFFGVNERPSSNPGGSQTQRPGAGVRLPGGMDRAVGAGKVADAFKQKEESGQ